MAAGVNTTLTMYDESVFQLESTRIRGDFLDEQEAARLRENVAFWREKVDLLLQEKKESITELMIKHKQIRDFEDQLSDLRVQLRDKGITID